MHQAVECVIVKLSLSAVDARKRSVAAMFPQPLPDAP